NSQASGVDSSAFGTTATATAADASAFGRGTSATFANSTAIGANATAIRANQMVFGTGTNTYTAAGITSAASKAAQTGATQLVTSDAAGNLATTGASFENLQSDINNNTQGVAMALAMSGGATILPECKMVAVSA